ncbi:MAG: peptidylprolyl isomerase [Eubacteriales bacterium]|nr:peptidylprolyl isomerase [Eubacteriales bacterium]
MRRILAAIALICLLGLTGCAPRTDEPLTKETAVRFELTDGRSFVITVMPAYAPLTATAFVRLVREGYYDGKIVHRIRPNFVVQMGQPLEGGMPPTVTGEFSANGHPNALSHTRGTVSLARATSYDSGSSQFFICLTDQTRLDGNYAAFGRVTEGMEVIDSFAKLELVYSPALREVSSPVDPPTIARAYVIE